MDLLWQIILIKMQFCGTFDTWQLKTLQMEQQIVFSELLSEQFMQLTVWGLTNPKTDYFEGKAQDKVSIYLGILFIIRSTFMGYFM